jgi:8-oxo-dGTP diphosphatase
VRVGVQCFVLDGDRLLLGRRRGVFGDGSWGLPGGHLEQGETVTEAALRELGEETGLAADAAEIVAIADATAENNFHLQLGCLIHGWRGTPVIGEPGTCAELAFFGRDALPEPLFVSSAPLIARLARGVLY